MAACSVDVVLLLFLLSLLFQALLQESDDSLVEAKFSCSLSSFFFGHCMKFVDRIWFLS
jgi:hypothetical protein